MFMLDIAFKGVTLCSNQDSSEDGPEHTGKDHALDVGRAIIGQVGEGTCTLHRHEFYVARSAQIRQLARRTAHPSVLQMVSTCRSSKCWLYCHS